MKTRIITAIALSIALAYTARAQVPGIINYQGRITTGGTNFTGSGQFKFSLVNGPPGTTTYWSNGTSAVSIAVTNGLYSVLLGDTSIPNMGFVIPTTVFSNSDVRLHVLFDGGSGLLPLSPDQRIGAAGYALNAAVAAGISGSGDITGQRLKIGVGNVLSGTLATIAGGSNNTASGDYDAIGGGLDNIASAFAVTVSGGQSNTASRDYATVSGGWSNAAAGYYSTVGGGVVNSAMGTSATVGGGFDNIAYGFVAVVGGGSSNIASNDATVAGGVGNIAGGAYSTITGGRQNAAGGNSAAVAGGYLNTASGFHSSVGGGDNNKASGSQATVGGGSGNTASNLYSVVAGGQANSVQGDSSTIGGGQDNQVLPGAYVATLSGGTHNRVGGAGATIPGGNGNKANGINSFAAGTVALATNDGAFVWTDSSSYAGFASTEANQFLIRAYGGVGIGTAAPHMDLAIERSLDGDYGAVLGLINRGSGAGTATAIRFGVDPSDIDGGLPGRGTDWPNAEIKAVNAGAGGNPADIVFSAWNGSALNEVLRIVGLYGYVGIGTASPSMPLDVATTGYGGYSARFQGGALVSGLLYCEQETSTKILTIRGGADVAEPFHITTKDVPKGAVVVIDEGHPGQLKLSEHAYDSRVAGILSGANGINPGITLSQQGAVEGGQNIALSGRVYALADASTGPIKPGDLLTTSDTPGHCMKVTDHDKAQGAIIGKAMSALESGRGMVLVLVSLQ